jgi:hypothetical protein
MCMLSHIHSLRIFWSCGNVKSTLPIRNAHHLIFTWDPKRRGSSLSFSCSWVALWARSGGWG